MKALHVCAEYNSASFMKKYWPQVELWSFLSTPMNRVVFFLENKAFLIEVCVKLYNIMSLHMQMGGRGNNLFHANHVTFISFDCATKMVCDCEICVHW